MTRRRVHGVFAATTFILAALAIYEASALQRAEQVNAAIRSDAPATAAVSVPEARFKHAASLTEAGDYGQAAAEYKELARSERTKLRRAAMFNLGNLHIREAIAHGPDSDDQWLPMIELAKQSYRNLLREHPDEWDARYNLELALRLAPEADDTPIIDEGPPPDSERATSTISGARMDLP